MGTDPRGMVKTDRIELVQEWGSEYFHIQSLVSDGCAGGDWPELVAFAKAILAADSEWLDSQTPTLEELRERYPDFYMNVDTHPPTNTTWFAAFYPVGDEMNPRYGSNMESEKAALRWLAAELAKHGEDTKNG